MITLKSEVAFNFMQVLMGETYAAAKERIEKRGTEILQGINCSEDERICLTALFYCRAESWLIEEESKRVKDSLLMSDLTTAEMKLENNDIDGYINAIFFQHLDEEKYKKVKAELWDEISYGYEKNEYEREMPTREREMLEEGYPEDEKYEALDNDMVCKKYRYLKGSMYNKD